jgi:glycosyltransferase involved in cell wall biosynthesis
MRICLSMIVKNESAVIERCLRSVRPYIHAWAIADTGSSDGTQELIQKSLHDLPGELIQRPWVDFATNRNQALELAAKFGDFALIIDADEVIEAEPDFSWPRLDAPGYMLELIYGDTRYRRVALPALNLDWIWRGVLHEALVSAHAAQAKFLPGLRIRVFTDGARSQQSQEEKFSRDAEVLQRALKDEPNNARYAFYFAQSLRDAGKPAEALAAYQARVKMGGWAEEVYFSLLQIAALMERTGAESAHIIQAYLNAYDFRPTRAEAVCDLARYCRLQGKYFPARDFARTAAQIVQPDDVLFIDRTVYDWRARDELSVALYYTNERAESATLCRALLADSRLPAEQRPRIQANLDFANAARQA